MIKPMVRSISLAADNGARTATGLAALSLLAMSALAGAPALARGCAGVADIAAGSSQIMFKDWAGPPLPVYLHRPADADDMTPIVFIMHGNGRDGDRYRDEWRDLADKHGFMVVAPTFSDKDFAGSNGYNTGNLFDAGGQPRPAEERSFSAIEPLFDDIVCGLHGRQQSYAIYGHSAGGQFVHRYTAFADAPRMKRAVAANAGWYTMPDLQQAFPYGWGGEVSGMVNPAHALAQPLTVLLGTDDIDSHDSSLRRTEAANLQGPTRFARGHSFFAAGKALAQQRGTPFGWQVAYAPGVAHDNGGMAEYAVPFLLDSAAADSASAAPAPGDTPQILMARADVADALATIKGLEANWAVDRLVALNEIPAPPFGEGPRGIAFADMLRAVGGIDVTIDELGNVIGRRAGQGGGKTVMLAAHLDTVFPIETDVTVKRDGNRFTAPGIGDNTRGLVTILLVAEAMQRAKIATQGDVLFVGSVGEEGAGDLRGMRHLFANSDHGVESVIAIDGGDAGRVVAQAVGSHRYRVAFTGPGGHSYGAFGTVNPHQATARAIADFVERADLVAKSGTKATFSIASISGGIGINVIPTESIFEIDMRSADPNRLDALDSLLKSSIEDVMLANNAGRGAGEELAVQIDDLGKRPAASNAAGSPLVSNALDSLTALGIQPELTASSTDANLPMSLGIPSITMSRGGRSERSHSGDEYWVAESPELGPQAALLVIALQAGLAQ